MPKVLTLLKILTLSTGHEREPCEIVISREKRKANILLLCEHVEFVILDAV
jgi:hypothetical protein